MAHDQTDVKNGKTERSKEQFIELIQRTAPISKAEVEKARAEGRMQHMPVEGAVRNNDTPLEWFYTDETKAYVAVVLLGRNTNPFRGYAYKLPTAFWLGNGSTVPKYRFSGGVFRNSSTLLGWQFMLIVYTGGNNIQLNRCVLSCLGGKGCLNFFHSPLDFSLKNITTTMLGACGSDGAYGIRFQYRKWYVQENFSTLGKRHYLGFVDSKLEAQQLYNTHLLAHKKQNPANLHCFGWCFGEDGVLLPPFPPDYYLKNGVLKAEYRSILLPHAHLFAALRDMELIRKIQWQGDDWMGMLYDPDLEPLMRQRLNVHLVDTPELLFAFG